MDQAGKDLLAGSGFPMNQDRGVTASGAAGHTDRVSQPRRLADQTDHSSSRTVVGHQNAPAYRFTQQDPPPVRHRQAAIDTGEQLVQRPGLEDVFVRVSAIHRQQQSASQ